MKYKVGDKVRVRKDLKDDERRYYMIDKEGRCYDTGNTISKNMLYLLGKIVTISELNRNQYKLNEDINCYNWTDEMFEDLTYFTKQDLQDGDYVTDRNGCEYIVSLKFGKFIDTKRLYMSINSYSADLSLIDADFKGFDIMKVERNGKIIWEREEKSERDIEIDKIKAQMEELSKKLDELRG